MKTSRLRHTGPCTSPSHGWICALVGAITLGVSVTSQADVPDASSGKFGGLYKVESSTDPLFPATQSTEYFLDFGRGIQADKTSGSVAISVRQNPSVKVRILAWQYFPKNGKIMIGNPYSEGSKTVVARGSWNMKAIREGLVFERGNYQVILQRADPGDY